MTDEIETWLPVPDWPAYEVSDMGRVRSVDRTVMDSNGVERRLRGTILAPHRRPDGHLDVGLMINHQRRMVRVHTLVLEAFAGPRPVGMQTCHSNDIGTDNRLANLRWGTRSDNMQDMVRNGNHYQANKRLCPRGHVLAEPNLVFSLLKTGHRQCRSCAAARALAGGKRPSIRREDIQAVADKYYERWTPAQEPA